MTLDEMRAVVAASAASDWNDVAHAGPTHLDWHTGGADALRSHHSRAVLKTDVSIGIAYGMQYLEKYVDDWITNAGFTGTAFNAWIDVLLYGQVVDREYYVYVDERMKLPQPRAAYHQHGHQVSTLGQEITRWQFDVVRLANELDGGEPAVREYERYVERAGFFVAD